MDIKDALLGVGTLIGAVTGFVALWMQRRKDAAAAADILQDAAGKQVQRLEAEIRRLAERVQVLETELAEVREG